MQLRSLPRWWLAPFVLWLTAAFLLTNAWLLQMHPDEELSYRSTEGDLAYTLEVQTSVRDNQAPLWFVSFWAWRQWVGDGEYTSRVFSAFCALLALAVMYRLGRRWFRSALVGLLAPLLLIGNGFFFNYALDIRPYPLLMLCAALSMWAFTRWVERPTARRTLGYGLTIALILYLHYLLIFLVVAQGVYFLLAEKVTLRRVWQAALALLIGFGLWLPWAPTFVNQVVGLRNIEQASGTARGAAGIGVSTLATTPENIFALLSLATNGLVWLYGLLLLLALVLLWRKKSFWLALAWAFGITMITLLANLVAAVYAPRFVSHIMLPFALVIAAGLVALPRRRVALLGAALLVSANLLTFPATIPVRVPFRDLYGEMSRLGRAGDAVLLVQGGEDDGFVRWQYQHYLSPELQAGVTTDFQQAEQARRLWLLTEDWFDPAVRDQFALLERTHPVQQVLGRCDTAWCYLAQLMEAPPLASPDVFGQRMAFWGIDVDAVTRERVDARLWWRVDQPPALDYSISLRLVSAGGEIVAQNDGAINHYGTQQVETSQLEPGRIYIDWRSLPLPLNLAPGAYTLELVVYQSWDNLRLLLPDDRDALALDSLTFP